jgi:hypothetical protein
LAAASAAAARLAVATDLASALNFAATATRRIAALRPGARAPRNMAVAFACILLPGKLAAVAAAGASAAASGFATAIELTSAFYFAAAVATACRFAATVGFAATSAAARLVFRAAK